MSCAGEQLDSLLGGALHSSGTTIRADAGRRTVPAVPWALNLVATLDGSAPNARFRQRSHLRPGTSGSEYVAGRWDLWRTPGLFVLEPARYALSQEAESTRADIALRKDCPNEGSLRKQICDLSGH